MFQENYENTAALNAFIILPLLPLLQLEKQLLGTSHTNYKPHSKGSNISNKS